MRIALLTLCALLGLWAWAVQGQELAGGWSKAHANLRNSNVHPTTGAIRSLDNTEFVVLFEEEWENGGAAHDQEGNSYFPATHTLFQLNKEGDWTSGPLSTAKHYGHAAVTDNGKVVVLSEHSLDVFDLASQTNITTSWDTIDYVLQGSSAVVVDGLIYVLNSDGEMMVFDFDLQLQAFNNASRYWDQSNFLDFCTPATDGEGTFYFFTESDDSGVVFAIHFPENELLWNRSMAELDPLPSLGYYPTKGSPSLSEDGTRLFVPVATGGVVALDTSNGDLVWATAIADLSEGSYFSGKLVPTISPVDGAIITHWIQLPNDTVVVVGLDPETGEQVHLLKTLTNKGGDIFSPGAVSADGVYYFSVYGVMGAVDLESFELLWYREEEYGVDFQSISIAADGSVYFPLEWDSIAVLSAFLLFPSSLFLCAKGSVSSWCSFFANDCFHCRFVVQDAKKVSLWMAVEHAARVALTPMLASSAGTFVDTTVGRRWLCCSLWWSLPYLPFLTVWVEGSYGYGGSMAGTAPIFFDMQPVFASFSQAHNILQCTPLSTTRGKPYFPLSAKWSSSSSSASSSEVAVSLHEVEGEAKKHPLPFWTLVRPSKEVVYANIQAPTPVRLSEQKLLEEQETSLTKGGVIFNDDDGETLLRHGSEFRWKSGQYHFGLEVACPRLNTSRLMRMLMVHHHSYTRLSNDTMLMRGELEGTTYRGPFYHLDKEGRTYLSGEQQFEATLRRLDDLGFFERLLTKLANGEAKGLHFPQAKHNFTDFFCNEEVYATLKISLICGFVRMA